MPLLKETAPPWLGAGISPGKQLELRSRKRLQFFDKQNKHEMMADFAI